MATSGFRRRAHSSRFRGSKFAKKKLIWCTSSASFFEGVLASPTRQVLLFPAQWVTNSTASDLEHAKLLRLVIGLSSTTVVAAQTRIFSLSIDDANDTAHDPSQAASYGAYEPFAIGRYLQIATGFGGTQPSNGHRDNILDYKVNRKIRSDETLNLTFEAPGVAANQMTFSIIARMLVQLN